MLTIESPALKRLTRSFEVRMKLIELIAGEPGATIRGSEDTVVSGLSYDSRTTQAGDLFFAVQGTFDDGNTFVAEAIERGAVAVVSGREIDLPPAIPLVLVRDERRAKGELASLFYGRPSTRLKCVGVTGTNGKTTTSHMIRSILEQNGWSTGLIGTIHHLVGRKEIRAETTTPDAVDVQRYLAQMVDENQDAAVLEVSSHALVQLRTEAVRLAAGVFTNLSREHLDYHRTMEEYRKAKSLLFASLDPAAAAVINADDEAGEFMAGACRCPVLTYGVSEIADVRGEVRRLDIDGFSMILKTPVGEIDVTSRLLGRHNVSNALAASAAATALGVPLSACKSGLEALTAIRGRVESIDVGQDFRVIVDYAHTDDALRKLLENLRPLTTGRLITVFGCGGDRDVFKRPLMAQAATNLSDLTIVTSDNPRSEDALKIIDDILRGCVTGSNLRVEPDRRAAIELAIREARGGDIVAIAGKGHEDYQILNTGVVDFDDREVAKEVLWKLSR
jgi:UDP-N-acetylmuramoyl-L-alanyl-D-glutamate--2,6-diaminopimelate ligase